MKTVYFFCSGNSNRAQLAQGFAEIYLKDKVRYTSTSFPDQKKLHPLAIMVMKEIGIDISKYESPKFDPSAFQQADYIISICEEPLDTSLPIPNNTKHVHIQIEDPLLSEDYFEQLKTYRKVRDQLGMEIKKIAKNIDHELILKKER